MTQDLESERELARRAGGGEEASWRVIYDSTCDRLFALLVYQIGDRDEARDLLQETYLQAFRHLKDYRGEAPLAVWLRTIALRKAMDWKRGVLQRLKRNDPLKENLPARGDPSPGVHFDSERAALHRALERLSPQQRAALLLREWEERSFREIASVLGCNESTARVHHTRARARMRSLLGQELVPLGTGDWEGQQA